jgi:DNA-binding response OmpR family regulator
MSRILIVEDDLSIAELERDYLEISRFEVKICRDGTEGEGTDIIFSLRKYTETEGEHK